MIACSTFYRLMDKLCFGLCDTEFQSHLVLKMNTPSIVAHLIVQLDKQKLALPTMPFSECLFMFHAPMDANGAKNEALG